MSSHVRRSVPLRRWQQNVLAWKSLFQALSRTVRWKHLTGAGKLHLQARGLDNYDVARRYAERGRQRHRIAMKLIEIFLLLWNDSGSAYRVFSLERLYLMVKNSTNS